MTMKHGKARSISLPALLVFVLFALCLLLVLLTGARVYRGLVARGEESFARRTAVQYIATRVRQAETVAVEDFGGCQTLVLGETVEGEAYLTRVYCYEGWLMELFCAQGSDLSPEDGERVLEAADAGFTWEGDLLRVRTGGQELYLYLRKGEVP